MSSSEAQRLIQEISTKVYSAIPDWVQDEPVQSADVSIVLRPWSFMLRYPLVRGGAVLLKVARHEEMAIDKAVQEPKLLKRTEREYEMLSQIAEVFERLNGEADAFCYVRPLEIFPEWNALVMEELDAVPLKKYLLRPQIFFSQGADWQEFEKLVQNSARWLRVYHEGMEQFEPKPLSKLHIWGRISYLFGELSKYLPKKDFSELRGLFRQHYETIVDRKVKPAMIHGDFHCGNIMITRDGRVGALDADLTRSPAYRDLAKFYADIETRGIQVLLRGAFLNRKKLQSVYRAIVSGYFGEEACDEKVFNFFIALAILEKWLIDETTLSLTNGKEALARQSFAAWRRSYFVKLLSEKLA